MAEPTAPEPTTSALGTASLALHTAVEAGAVELVAQQRPVQAMKECGGSSGDAGGRRSFIDLLAVATLCGIVTRVSWSFVI